MVGQWIRLNRLFSTGGRAVIVSVEEGQFASDGSPLTNVPEVVGDLTLADGILLSSGMLRHCGNAFDYRGAPLAVVRLDWTSIYSDAPYDAIASSEVLSVRAAQGLGADLVLANLTLTREDAAVDASSMAMFCRFATQKHECGLPLLGVYYPRGARNMVREQLFDQVHAGCRVLAELGADVAITIYTGERFAETVAACPVPVLAMTQDVDLRQLEALRFAYDAVKSGARGVVFGTQVTGSANPGAFLRALNSVVKDENDPEAAAEEFGVR